MNRKDIEEYKKQLRLTPRQREIIVGKCLGDGHLETENCGRTYKLRVEHSAKQKEYVYWLYEAFKEWVRTPPQEKTQRLARFPDRVYRKYWFNTLSSGVLRYYAQQFYRDRKKVVPKQIERLLTPLALAVWYMDDGSVKSKEHRTVLLNTQGFSAKDLAVLQRALRKKFLVHTTIRKQREGDQLYVVSESADTFLTLIEPHCIPSLRYKLPKVWLTSLHKK